MKEAFIYEPPDDNVSKAHKLRANAVDWSTSSNTATVGLQTTNKAFERKQSTPESFQKSIAWFENGANTSRQSRSHSFSYSPAAPKIGYEISKGLVTKMIQQLERGNFVKHKRLPLAQVNAHSA